MSCQLLAIVQQHPERNHGSENTNESINGRACQYHFRQLSMKAGYSKFVQGFSASGPPSRPW